MKRAADCIFERYTAKRDFIKNKKGIIIESNETRYDFGLIDVYFMLIGLTVENLIKKIIINQNPNFENNLNTIKSHDIVKLMKDNNIRGLEKYYDLMEKLQVYVEWKGRYTIPISFDQMIEKQEIFPHNPDDPKQEIDELYKELCMKLNQETKLQYIRDDTGCKLSYKEYLEIKREIIAFIKPKEGEIQVGDISKAFQGKEIEEALGYHSELIGTILMECLDEVIARSNHYY